MSKKIISVLALLLGLLSFSINSCQQNDPPPSIPSLMQSITNDAMGAIGGVQTAIQVAGPPMNPAQAFCYAVVGTWTGLSASGAFQFGQPGWEVKYGSNMNIDKINQTALALYDKGNLEYAKLGRLHNNMLHKWATTHRSASFGDNTLTKEFMRKNFDATAEFADPCEGELWLRMGDKLTRLGTTSNVSVTTIQELENQFNVLAQENPNLASGIQVIKGITINACNMYIAGYYQQLNGYLHQEVNKVNSNYYSLDLSNFTIAMAMINIVTHSYYYWVYYEE